jgi:hypothetical protein
MGRSACLGFSCGHPDPWVMSVEAKERSKLGTAFEHEPGTKAASRDLGTWLGFCRRANQEFAAPDSCRSELKRSSLSIIRRPAAGTRAGVLSLDSEQVPTIFHREQQCDELPLSP